MTQEPSDRRSLGREEISIDPKLRALSEQTLAMPVADRLRQIQAEADFFASVRPLDD